MSEEKKQGSFLVVESEDSNYAHLKLQWVTFSESWKVRNDVGGACYNLEVSCSLHKGTPPVPDQQPYGWEVQYTDVYYVNLSRAEEMVKVLRKVSRGLEQISRRYGAPSSYSEWVLRVCNVLGVKTVVAETRESARRGTHDYTEKAFRQMGLEDLRSYLESRLAYFRVHGTFGPQKSEE